MRYNFRWNSSIVGVYASSKRLPRKRATIDDLPAREELHGKMKKASNPSITQHINGQFLPPNVAHTYPSITSL